uniref:FLYWCH-type domain-containing protein n=1 Tax=Ditylenchus dipsaci TaxID=166011 RepID=A0A915DZS6_9BILA
MDARSMLEALGGYSSEEDYEQQAVVDDNQQAVVEIEQQAVVEVEQQAEPIISVTSKRDQRKMTHNQFVFWKQKNSKDGERTFWVCIKKEEGCNKRIHTSIATGRVVKEMGIHSHEADPTAIQVAQFKTSLKRRAVDTMEVCFAIISCL